MIYNFIPTFIILLNFIYFLFHSFQTDYSKILLHKTSCITRNRTIITSQKYYRVKNSIKASKIPKFLTGIFLHSCISS